MKKLFLLAAGFVGGYLAFAALYSHDVDDRGDVAYEDDNIKVIAGASKGGGWCMGKIEYKNEN